MKAAPEVQLRLLDLQEVDTALDRARQRRTTLPELAEHERLAVRSGELRDALALAEAEQGDLTREQAKAEADVEQVRSRAARDQQRLDSGGVGSAKELESLQSELASLARRKSSLEEVVLEVMERREEVDGRVERLRSEAAEVGRALDVVAQRRDLALAQLEDELERLGRQRGALAAELPADLVALYERLRGTSGGTGAARLHRGRCEGCHLQLGAADLSALRAAAEDEVARCEECRRILVRTSESGL